MSAKSCNNLTAVAFIYKFRNDCELIAKQLNVPVENILGLAAQESQYGVGRIASECNNYFSMHAPAPLQIGEESAHGNAKVKIAKFASFSQSAQSFAMRYGSAVKGKSDPKEFAQALVCIHFNTGDASTGGRGGFAPYLTGIIQAVKERMLCPK